MCDSYSFYGFSILEGKNVIRLSLIGTKSCVLKCSDLLFENINDMARPRYLTDEELVAILNASDDEEEDDDFSDIDENFLPDESIELIENESDSDFEDEDEDGEGEEERATSNESEDEIVDPLFVSKDGTVWKTEPVQNQAGRLRNENVITLRPGTTRYARTRVDEIKDAFLLFFPPPIENIIVKWSNEYAKTKYGDKYMEIDSNLLYAYIAVLILAGVYRCVISFFLHD